jgi:hypothetical protein
MEEAEKVVVSAAQEEDEVEELVRKLIRKGVLEVRPSLDKVGVRYVEAEEAWNVDSARVKSMLAGLEKKGILKSEFSDRVLTCPHCGSPEVHSKYACSRCKSDNVEFTELFEHIKCGYIGSKDTFVKEDVLACPRCQTVLGEGSSDHRVIGNFYQCEKCLYRFDKPDVVHFCQNCGTTSTHQTAKYIKIFGYRIPDETIREFQKELPILKNIKKILTDRGFKVQVHAKVAGSSGVESPFDIFAEKDDVRLVADVSLSGDKNDIVALLAKKVDVNPTRAVIVDLSTGDELANLGKVYDIAVLKTSVDRAVPYNLESLLAELDSKMVRRKSSEGASAN